MQSKNTLDAIVETERNNFRPFRYRIALDLRPFSDNHPDFMYFADLTDVNVNDLSVVAEHALAQPELPEPISPASWNTMRPGYSWLASITPGTLLRLYDAYPGSTVMEDIVNAGQKSYVDVHSAMNQDELFDALLQRTNESAARMRGLFGLEG